MDDPLVSLEADEGHGNSNDEDLLKMTPPTGKPSSCGNEADTESHDHVTEIFGQMKWKLCALLWWAVGIHLSFLSSSTDPSADIKMVSLMCLLSLSTLGVKVFLTETKSCSIGACASEYDAGYFVLGLLGLNGLMLRFFPMSTDTHCFSLLFTMGFFHQLQPLYKMTQVVSDYRIIIDRICAELALTFCAMAIGYPLANIINNYVLVPIVASNFCSASSLLMISAAIVLLSLQHSTKVEESIKNPTVKSECHGQA